MNTTSEPIGSQPHSSMQSMVRQTVVLATIALAIPLSVLLCIVAALVPTIPWWVGILVGLAVAVGFVMMRLRRASDLLLGALAAARVSAEERPRFHNIAEGLSLAGGVDQPELFVVDDDGRNIAAVAHGPRSAIVASRGLLESFDRISLEGVVAEALVRIRSGDAEAATLGFALFGPLLAGPLGALGRPVAALGLGRLLPDDRDLAADRDAVALTRYPPGLHSGLSKIRAGDARVARASGAAEHAWLVPPSAIGPGEGAGTGDGVLESVPLDLRIDVLGEL